MISKKLVFLSFLVLFNLNGAESKASNKDYLRKVHKICVDILNTPNISKKIEAIVKSRIKATIENMAQNERLSKSDLVLYAALKTEELESRIENDPNPDIKPKKLLEFAYFYFLQDKFVPAIILLNEVINNITADPKEDDVDYKTLSEARFLLGRLYETQSMKIKPKSNSLADFKEFTEEQSEFEEMARELYQEALAGPKIQYEKDLERAKAGIELSLSFLDNGKFIINKIVQHEELIKLIIKAESILQNNQNDAKRITLEAITKKARKFLQPANQDLLDYNSHYYASTIKKETYISNKFSEIINELKTAICEYEHHQPQLKK